jgi:toxin ParE1/3/4
VARVIWSRRARGDFNAVRYYLARTSPSGARLFAERATYATRRLERFPNMGRIVPEDRYAELREVFAFSYRIIYEVREDAVEILMIHHGARRLTDLPDV